jgi:hypothetical protein
VLGGGLNRRLVVVITWDESSSDTSNCIPTIVISPTTNHVQDPTPQTHCTLLRTIEDLLHLPALGCAGTHGHLRHRPAPATGHTHVEACRPANVDRLWDLRFPGEHGPTYGDGLRLREGHRPALSVP